MIQKLEINILETFSSRRPRPNSDIFFYGAIIVFGILMLAFRLDNFNLELGKYLWAEDGKVFLNQAQHLGIKSLFKPYAGYILLYPRIIAFLAILIDIIYWPLVMLAGWVLAYAIMLFSITRTARIFQLGFPLTALLVALVVFQPNSGESFFNVTNAQWMLGLSLILLVLVDDLPGNKSTILAPLILGLLCLTGPFSIILAGILLARLFLCGAFGNNRSAYIVVFVGAAIQSVVFLISDRGVGEPIDKMIWDWVLAFWQMIFFGANTIDTFVSALNFWIVYIWLARQSFKREGYSCPLFLLLSGILLIVASLYAQKSYPLSIIVLGEGNRYAWIPYSLFIISGVIYSHKNKYALAVVVSMVSFLCFNSFKIFKFPDYQFDAFANFSKYRKVVIPINPQWPIYPGWHVQAGPFEQQPIGERGNAIIIKQSDLKFSSIDASMHSGKVSFHSIGPDPIIFFKSPVSCQDGAYIGVEIDISRSSAGWMQLFWDANQYFSEKNSLRRWYPEGRVHAQFAFKNLSQSIYLRFDPMEHIGYGDISNIRVFCLERDGKVSISGLSRF